ncbi:spore germination protein KA [Cohnella sp. SGD-V74]|uniref:spore germination protein n=1 Tax=unclassified Cohnella TaxID=2636738 RepID=UPI000D49740E|nr:spore germination protein KA [Cohnella sp. SGD-V74]
MNNLSRDMRETLELILSLMGRSPDLIVRDLELASGQRLVLLYLDGMVDKQAVQNNVIGSLLDRAPAEQVPLHVLQQCVIDAGEVGFVDSVDELLDQLLSGCLIVLTDGTARGLFVGLPGWEDRNITESKTQSVVRGPQDSFTETLRTNTTLVRRRVKDPRIRMVNFKVGSRTKTDVTLMYISGLANEKLVEQISGRLNAVRIDRVLEGEYIEELLRENKGKTIFPTLYNTDRPDVIAGGILEGRIAIFVDNTPFVLLAPTLFVDYMQSAEDYYQSMLYSNAIRLLRYVSLFICMLAPSVYIALTTFHQDMLPTQLLLSLAAQREGIPFPAFLEALLMEVTFEILREAGIRMPRTIGQAVSIVGTIVIGQAAVDASIVSPAMVIIVAITAIASFVIPSYSMSVPIRFLRFVFMGLAAVMGVYGLTIGFIILTIHLCHLQSFGIPYMSPMAPFRKGMQKDAVLRLPYHSSKSAGSARGKR